MIRPGEIIENVQEKWEEYCKIYPNIEGKAPRLSFNEWLFYSELREIRLMLCEQYFKMR